MTTVRVKICCISSIEEALRVVRAVDALLLDSGNQSLPVKELGGTGRTHDWSLSAKIVGESTVPVYLAGGSAPPTSPRRSTPSGRSVWISAPAYAPQVRSTSRSSLALWNACAPPLVP